MSYLAKEFEIKDLGYSKVQLFRIQFRVPEYGWTTQKVFHLMNFIVNGWQSSWILLYVFLIKSKALEMVLLDLPVFYFSQHIHYLSCSAEIYHQSLPINKLRPAYYIINGLISIWISIRLSQSPIAIEVAKLFFSCDVMIILVESKFIFFLFGCANMIIIYFAECHSLSPGILDIWWR
ncbi:hypothetical protein AAG906_026393 [Vitis piasezkii]